MMPVEIEVRRRRRRGQERDEAGDKVKDAVKGGLTEEGTMMLKLG
jgi:hypothetical protein